jgi:hypothetical protein
MRPARRLHGPLLTLALLVGVAGTPAGPASAVTATRSLAPEMPARSGELLPIGSRVPADGVVGPVTRAALAAARRQPRPVIVLQSDGLGFLTGTSSIRQVPFAGDTAAAVRRALAAALGPLTVTPLPECGQGPRTSASRAGFSVLLDGRRFVGWTDQGTPGRHLTTADGLGIGSTLRQLRRSLGTVTVTTGTLGPEWTSPGGLSGLLDGTRPGSRATLIDSGETCFFR